MSIMIPPPILPTPPRLGLEGPRLVIPDLIEQLKKQERFNDDLMRELGRFFVALLGASSLVRGGDLVVDNHRLGPNAGLHRVRGGGEIRFIEPEQGFAGPVTLLAQDEFVLLGDGNVAVGQTIYAGSAVTLFYDDDGKRWFPNL